MEQSNKKLLKQRETRCDPISKRDSNRLSLPNIHSPRVFFLSFLSTILRYFPDTSCPEERISSVLIGTTKQGTGEGRKLDRGPTVSGFLAKREPEEKAGGQFLVLPKIETSISRSDRCQSAANRCPPARKIDSVSIVSPGLVARSKISWEAKGDSLPFAFFLFSSTDFLPSLSTTICLLPLSSFCNTGRFRNTVSILDRVNLRSKIRKKCKCRHLGKIFCIFSQRKNCMNFFSFHSKVLNLIKIVVCMIYME